MDEIFTIEEGIEIPKNGSGRRLGSGKWEQLCASMKVTTEDFVGSSILFTGGNKRSQTNAMRTSFKRLGFNIVTRKQGDGLRVWKVAK